MKKVICFIIALFSFIAIHSITSKKLSSKIKKVELTLAKKEKKLSVCRVYYINYYDKLRSEIDFLKLIKPNYKNDTIFILQGRKKPCDRELFIALWNKNKEFQFFTEDTLKQSDSLKDKKAYDQMKLFKADKKYNLFTRRMVLFVSNWDSISLKNESKKNHILSDIAVSYVAIRIIFTDNNIRIENFSFRDIFDFEKDYVHLNSDSVSKYLTLVKRRL